MLNSISNLIQPRLTMECITDEMLLVRILFNEGIQKYSAFEDKLLCTFLMFPISKIDYIFPVDLIEELVLLIKPLILKFILEVKIMREQKNIRNIMALNSILNRKVSDSKKLTVFVDLDETLILSSTSMIDNFDIKLNLGISPQYIKIRPNLAEFIYEIQKFSNLFLYTAAGEKYTTAIVEHLNIKFDGVLYKKHCIEILQFYFKDIRILGVDVKKSIIIDNFTISYALNYENGIKIKDYNGSEDDDELIRITKIVKRLEKVNDVRLEIKINKFNLE